MNELIDLLKSQPKEVLQYIILTLMKDECLSYEDITSVYIQYLKKLKDGATEDYLALLDKITYMWADHKKNLMTNLKEIMRYLKDEGRINITDKQIDKR